MDWKEISNSSSMVVFQKGNKWDHISVFFDKLSNDISISQTSFIRNEDCNYIPMESLPNTSCAYGHFITSCPVLQLEDIEWINLMAKKILKTTRSK